MTHFTVDARDPDQGIIATVAAIVRAGGVVAYPTDTLYGLAVDPRRDAAVRKLFDVKARDHSNPIALIAADTAQARTAGVLGADELRLAERFWPGPLTIVAPAAEGLSRWLTGELGTVGIRVPGHAVARALAAAFGAPITATSANLSGRPPAATADEAAAALEGRIDAVVDAGPVPGGAPSTIVEIIEGRPVLRRAGAIAWDRVLEALQRSS